MAERCPGPRWRQWFPNACKSYAVLGSYLCLNLSCRPQALAVQDFLGWVSAPGFQSSVLQAMRALGGGAIVEALTGSPGLSALLG